MTKELLIVIDTQSVSLSEIQRTPDKISGKIAGEPFSYLIVSEKDGWIVLQDEAGQQHRIYLSATDTKGRRTLMMPCHDVTICAASNQRKGSALASTTASSPMPGTVQSILVKVGASVKAGDTLAMMEAMKMQIAIPAPFDGIVAEICVAEGQQVPEATELVKIEKTHV